MLQIKNYSFGNININNHVYNKDLIIIGDRIIENWWRQTGHSITLEDISYIIDYQPDKLFIGTGKFGMMKVEQNFVNQLKTKGICNVVIEKSDDIIKKFTTDQTAKKALAIHLTC